MATEVECKIIVDRTNGSDGRITCDFATEEVDNIVDHRRARKGIDFEHTEGTLVFEHNVCQQEIVVKIIQKPVKEGEEEEKRDEVFGVKIFNAQPSVVKISKKDRIIVEIVTDAETKKQAEAL